MNESGLEDHVLIVDDDRDVRETLSEVVRAEGYEVAAAADGAEALLLLRQEGPVAVILLDLMMPRMDGWAFRQEQLADPVLEAVPVVVLTAVRDAGAEAERLRAVTFLKKPPDIDELFEVVGRFAPRHAL